MLLQEVTTILKVLLAAFQPIASQDALTQRRISQIGEVIGAVADVAEDEAEADTSIAEKRIAEAHDIIHRVARILALEAAADAEADAVDDFADDDAADADADYAFEEDDADVAGDEDEGGGDGLLKELPWNGRLDGETIALAEDEAE